MMGKIKECFCGSNRVEFQTDLNIFIRQNYGDRYPEPVATQNHGYKIRCHDCGMQTCWWHLKEEVYSAWNKPRRVITKLCDNCAEWENLKKTTDPYLIHCPTCGRALSD